MGTWLQVLHYADLWRKNRGPVSVFVLSSHFSKILKISKILFPELPIISAGDAYTGLLKNLFGHFCLQTQTFNPIYGILRSHRLDSIVLYDMPMRLEWPFAGHYSSHTDPCLKDPKISFYSQEFADAYVLFRKYSQFRHDHLIDYGRLVSQQSKYLGFEHILNDLKLLKQRLGIEDPYVILNINGKEYFDPILNRRTIHHPLRYESLVDELIRVGYTVVLQGREEQPALKMRQKLVDYSKSEHCSIAHDIALYFGCKFIISSKTGPEIFGTIFDKPTMGLNYVEPSSIIPSRRLRYHPKWIRKRNENTILSWREYYSHPSFFNFGLIHFDTNEEHEYLDLSESDLLDCLAEFLILVDQPFENWKSLSPLQREFKNHLCSLHLEAETSPGVPFDSYLRKG